MKGLLEVSIPVSFFREDDKYIAYTPVLDLSTYGSTEEEAKRRFSEVVKIFFDQLDEKGTLHEVLTELGWRRVDRNWQPPKVKTEYESIKLPALV
jgi:hypothetical protein